MAGCRIVPAGSSSEDARIEIDSPSLLLSPRDRLNMRIPTRASRRLSRSFTGYIVAFFPGFACVLLAAVVGCQANATKVGQPEPPVVPVSQPVQREVTDYVDFTGRTEAVYSVDIRPRVTGYLVEMPFEEGAEVKAGDLLFVVDPRPYKAQLDQAQGQVDLYQASLKLARTTLARDRAINASVARLRQPAAVRSGTGRG